MFYHAFDGYMRHAFPHDELKPLSCGGEDTLGGYALTLVNAMTLYLLNDHGVVILTLVYFLVSLASHLRLIHWTPWLCLVIESISPHLLNGLVKIFDLIL